MLKLRSRFTAQRISRLAANLVFLALLAPLSTAQAAAEPALTIRSGNQARAFKRSELWNHPSAREIEVAQDPAYGDKPMAYRGVPVYELFEGVNVPADATLQFKCLDGFSAPIDRDRLLNRSPEKSIAYVAIEPEEKKWPSLKPGKPETAGPFYIIWQDPKKSGISREEWPFQLAELDVKPSLASQYPLIVPDAKLPATHPARKGFQVFAKNCFACHTMNKQGSSKMGPDLNVPFSPIEYFSEKHLRTLIRNPQDLRYFPQAKMTGFPKSVLSDQDIDALFAYFKHMKDRKAR